MRSGWTYIGIMAKPSLCQAKLSSAPTWQHDYIISMNKNQFIQEMTNRYFKFTTLKLKEIVVCWTFHLPKPPSIIILKGIIIYTLISRRTGPCCIPCVLIIVSKGKLEKRRGQHREHNVPLHPLVDGDFIGSASSMCYNSSSKENFFQPYFVIGWKQEGASIPWLQSSVEVTSIIYWTTLYFQLCIYNTPSIPKWLSYPTEFYVQGHFGIKNFGGRTIILEWREYGRKICNYPYVRTYYVFLP